MTVTQCGICGRFVPNTVPCAECGWSPGTTVLHVDAPPTPESVGAEIRRLLFTLRAPGHTAEREKEGWGDYGSDMRRAAALDAAGICWHGSGKMFSRDDPCNGRPKCLDDYWSALRGVAV